MISVASVSTSPFFVFPAKTGGKKETRRKDENGVLASTLSIKKFLRASGGEERGRRGGGKKATLKHIRNDIQYRSKFFNARKLDARKFILFQFTEYGI